MAPDPERLRWKLLEDYDSLSAAERTEINTLVARMLPQMCTNVMRCRVEPMEQ